MDRFRALLAGLRPQGVFGMEEEADLVGEVPGAEMVVKLGPRGYPVGRSCTPRRRCRRWTRPGLRHVRTRYLSQRLGLAAAGGKVLTDQAVP